MNKEREAELKEEAGKQFAKVCDVQKRLDTSQIIIFPSYMEWYAERVHFYHQGDIIIQLMSKDPARVAWAFDELRRRYFFAGVVYALENPDVEKLIKPFSDGAKDRIQREIEKIMQGNQFPAKNQDTPSYLG